MTRSDCASITFERHSLVLRAPQIEDVFDALLNESEETLKPKLLAAREAGNWEEVGDLLQALQRLTRSLAQRFRTAFISPKLRLWFQVR